MPADPNPYAPPRPESELAPVGPRGETDSITCTVVLEVSDLAAGLAAASKRTRWLMSGWLFVMGLIMGAAAGIEWQIGQAIVLGAFGWLVASLVPKANARRSLANKSEVERTVTYGFSPEGLEVTTVTTYQRVKWAGVHRSVEGPKTFGLWLSEALVQVIPKRALRSEDIETLRTMFGRFITPRKRPSLGRAALIFAWLLLVLMSLSVWQFLQSDRPPEKRVPRTGDLR